VAREQAKERSSKGRNHETRVAVVGGGIAGLSAAHELCKFYDHVHVFEPSDRVGGKACSQDVLEHFQEHLGFDKKRREPLWIGEHGFRLFPHTYLHVTETMREIPFHGFRENGSGFSHVRDCLTGSTQSGYAYEGSVRVITRPFPKAGADLLRALRESFGDSPFGNEWDYATFVWFLLKFMTSCPERRDAEYDDLSWLEYVEADKGDYSASFEPLLKAIPRGLNAMKADVCSARSFGNMMLKFAFDFSGQRGLEMEKVLCAPTQLAWLEPWKRHLEDSGVVFWHGPKLTGFDFDAESGRVQRLRFELDKAAKVPAGRESWLEPPLVLERKQFWWTSKRFTDFVLAVPLEQALRLFGHALEPTVRHAKAEEADEVVVPLRQAARAAPRSISAAQKRAAEDREVTRKSVKAMVAFDHALERLGRIRNDAVSPMVGLQFFLRDSLEPLFGHMFYPGSPWALTSVSQAPFWKRSGVLEGIRIPLGKRGEEEELKGVLSVIISDWDKRCARRTHIDIDGAIVRLPNALQAFRPGDTQGGGKPAVSVAQLKREVWFQLKDALNEPGRPPRLSEGMLLGYRLVKGDRHQDPLAWLDELLLRSVHLDDSARDERDKRMVRPNHKTPLFVHPRGSYAVRPDAQLRIPNLFLASDYVRTHTDLATMEAANEAARRAALAILWRDGVHDSTRFPKLRRDPDPAWALSAQAVDRMLFLAGQMHFMDLPDIAWTMARGLAANVSDMARQMLGADPIRRKPAPLAPERMLERAESLIRRAVEYAPFLERRTTARATPRR
jgi:uncharacterized protein with NAD-binding domain and iron-sulfur cluster